jgi:hypothetical protein
MTHTHSILSPAPAQDPISRDSAQILAEVQEIRRLTVSYGARSIREPNGSSAPAPMLRLQGAWLKRAGFPVGVQVTVRVGAGRLVIEATEPAPVLHFKRHRA